MVDSTKCTYGCVIGLIALLSIVLSARAEDWVLPANRLGVRTAPLLILTRPEVQGELRLTSQQRHSLQRAVSDLHRRAAELRGKPDQDVIVARRRIDEEQQRWIESQLSREQQDRLNQIDLQWEGPAAMVTRPWVASALSLTSVQRERIAASVVEARVRGAGGADALESQRVVAQRVMGVLTEEQRNGWQSMLGRPVRFDSAPD